MVNPVTPGENIIPYISDPITALLVLKPVDGVMADFYTCMALALIISMPVIVFEVSKFIDPALKKQ